MKWATKESRSTTCDSLGISYGIKLLSWLRRPNRGGGVKCSPLILAEAWYHKFFRVQLFKFIFQVHQLASTPGARPVPFSVFSLPDTMLQRLSS